MIAIYSVIYFDDESSNGFSFTDENCPELTAEQFKNVLNQYIRDSYTKEIAQQCKSITMTVTEAGKDIPMACATMSYSERLAV